MSMQGYLKKRNERGVWQQRWFVLQGLELKYYNSQKDATGGKDPKGVIPVMTVQSAEYAGAIGGENHCFEIKVSSRTEYDKTITEVRAAASERIPPGLSQVAAAG